MTAFGNILWIIHELSNLKTAVVDLPLYKHFLLMVAKTDLKGLSFSVYYIHRRISCLVKRGNWTLYINTCRLCVSTVDLRPPYMGLFVTMGYWQPSEGGWRGDWGRGIQHVYSYHLRLLVLVSFSNQSVTYDYSGTPLTLLYLLEDETTLVGIGSQGWW